MLQVERLMRQALDCAALAITADEADRGQLLRRAYALRASAEMQEWIENEIPLRPLWPPLAPY
jgi:hypothetical protein